MLAGYFPNFVGVKNPGDDLPPGVWGVDLLCGGGDKLLHFLDAIGIVGNVANRHPVTCVYNCVGRGVLPVAKLCDKNASSRKAVSCGEFSGLGVDCVGCHDFAS